MNFFARIASRAFLSALLMAAAVAPVSAATITILNNDAAGVGFNDPAPRAPVGGNTGTTLGQQRLNLFNHAAAIWGSILPSSVVIVVRAQFAAQTCTSTGAVLGSAGAVTIHRDFAGADFPGTWYNAALANKLAGIDLSSTNPDINATFNLSIDSGCFGPGLVWYYGFDGLEGANIEFLPVLLHEMGHGLGFQTFTSGSTGNYNGGFPSIADRYLFDAASGLHWSQNSAAQRVASAISVTGLQWDGPAAIAAASTFLNKKPRMIVNAPAGIAGTYQIGTAAFGAPLTIGGISGNVVLLTDTTAPLNDGCEAVTNGAALAGNIALIDRGVCSFTIKAAAAQAAGAIGVIIANNAAGAAPGLGGSDPSIVIPVVSVSQADGNTIKANLGSGVNVSINLDPTQLAGASPAGRPLMYAPATFAGGSSVSHWDVSLTPNALMEPAINVDLHDSVDITTAMFQDIGWFPGVTATTLAMFTAEGRMDGIALRWQFSDPSDVATVTVERATAAQGPFSRIQTELAADNGDMVAVDATAATGTMYFYRLWVIDRAGAEQYLGMVSASRASAPVASVYLAVPKPNPMTSETAVMFRLGQPEYVRLSVTDASGRRVKTLRDGMMSPGEHTVRWNGMTDGGAQAPAGVYFVMLGTSKGNTAQRIALVH